MNHQPLTIDRMGSVRTFDADGRLRVESTPISKANICGYFGREIPNAEALGLNPEKTYRLLRDPVELERGAASFNGIPVLDDHPAYPARVTAENPQKNIVVGATMNAATFKAPYLNNALTIWDGTLIDKIKSGQQRELSCGYDYTPDMTPGTYEGERYDGRMTNILGNHIALVEKGRAGSDVLVADSQKGAPNMAEKDDKPGCDSPDDALKSILGEDCSPEKLDAIKELFSGAKDDDDERAAQDDDDERQAQDDEDDDNRAAQDDDDDDERTAQDDDEDEKTNGDQEAKIREIVDREVERRMEAAKAASQQLDQAKNDVRPLVGDVHGLDSARSVYRYALSTHGMATDGLKGVNTAGLKALVHSKIASLYPHHTAASLATDSAARGYTAPRKL